MPDTAPNNKPPPIPPKARPVIAWVSWALILIGPTAGLLIPMLTTGTTAKVLTAILGLLVAAAAALKSGLSIPWKAAGPTILILGALTLTACPAGQSVAWKATAGTMYAFKAADKSLAAAEGPKHKDCLQLHGPGAAAYAECIGATRRRLITFRDNIRPAGRSSVAAAYATIRTVEEAKKGKVDYLAILKPGACALIAGLREWGHKLPDKAASIMPWLSVFSGAVCDKVKNGEPKSAAAIITALLPVAVELVKWVISLVGADNSDLQKEINAWILGPQAGEVDALLTKITAALPGGGK